MTWFTALLTLAAEGLAPAERKAVERVAAKVRRGVSGATTVVSLGVVLVLEEVLRGLGLRFAGALFVAVGTEVAEGVREALRPGVRELEVEAMEVSLRHGGFQRIEGGDAVRAVVASLSDASRRGAAAYTGQGQPHRPS